MAPAKTSPAKEGIRNAIRYASTASPAPNERATITVFSAPESFTQAVSAPMRTVSDKIPRFISDRISDTGLTLDERLHAAVKLQLGEFLNDGL